MREEHSTSRPAPGGTREARTVPARGARARVINGSYASLVCRLVLGGVFAYAGASKIVNPGALAASIRSYALPLPEWFVSLSAHALPYMEVMLGLYLIAGLFTKASAWAANVLMLVFIAALLQGALRGLEIDCGCFGFAEASSGGVWQSLWVALARDLVFLALGLWLAHAGAGTFAVDTKLRSAKPYGRRHDATEDIG